MPPVPRTTRPPPKVLVAHASRHGSTAQIAERIAERLSSAGLEAVAMDVGEVEDPAIYDAYVIGGAAYMYHWLKPAMRFVMQNEGLFARRPVGPRGAAGRDRRADDEVGARQSRRAPGRRLPRLAGDRGVGRRDRRSASRGGATGGTVSPPRCVGGWLSGCAHRSRASSAGAAQGVARRRRRQLRCPNQLAVVQGATHRFEERGTLERVADLARDWFVHHPTAARAPA